MSGIQYEVLTGDDLISALRGGRTGDLLDDAAYAAADEIERLQRVLQKVMARCADLLDEDQFNELDAIARAAVSASEDIVREQRLAETEALLREESHAHYCFTQMTEYPAVTRMLLWHMDRKRRIDTHLAQEEKP
jgi:hypothetical protein